MGTGLPSSKILKAYATLIRQRISKIFIWPWVTAISLLIANHGFPPILPAVVTIASMWAIATCVYIYNDVIDLEMDKLNPEKLNRPLPSGKVSIKDAMNIVYLNGLVGMVLSLLVNLKTFLLCMAFMALSLAYSYPRIRLKKRFLLKEGTLAVGAVITFLIGGIVTGSVTSGLIFSAVYFFIFTLIISPALVDVPDIKEDKEHGVKSLAMVLSWKTRMEIVILFLLVTMTITPLTYVQLGFNVIFPITVVAACLLFLRFLFPLLSGFEQTAFRRTYKVMYGFWMLVQAGLVFGSFPLIF